MAHAAPVPRTTHAPATRRGAGIEPHRPPDILGTRTHGMARLAVPVALGLVYGYWAAANRRDAGPITGWNLLFGFVCAVVFAVLCHALLRRTPGLRRERRAALWAVFAGVAFGFLYSQTGHSVLRSCGISLAVAVAVFLFDYYRYYTHEDPGDEHWRMV
ncbi:hypothetical protein AB0C59_28365 [Streptomyces sp. NPDC048664]|uniref:hypothetical protein n=1 Tax=Streptomyces sp. NPDC048664 TaxID=3154505 RepID=UPI003442B147